MRSCQGVARLPVCCLYECCESVLERAPSTHWEFMGEGGGHVLQNPKPLSGLHLLGTHARGGLEFRVYIGFRV